MKLFAVSDGPPSAAVRMTLAALNIPYELKLVNYSVGDHLTDDYFKMNPQREIPVLDDDGFYLSESIAIMQYLCDKYQPDSTLYPSDPKARALVNHRLCFNMGYYYSYILGYALAPIYYDATRTELGLKKVNMALSVFETYLKELGTKYAAGNSVTLADFSLIVATLSLEAIEFSLDGYPIVKKWYETFKQEQSQLWTIAEGCLKELAYFNKNPPDLSHLVHPIITYKKNKK